MRWVCITEVAIERGSWDGRARGIDHDRRRIGAVWKNGANEYARCGQTTSNVRISVYIKFCSRTRRPDADVAIFIHNKTRCSRATYYKRRLPSNRINRQLCPWSRRCTDTKFIIYIIPDKI